MVDQRRLPGSLREYYRPGKVLEAIARAKNFKGNWSYQENKPKFRTEQKPGSGGFQAGTDVQAQRNWNLGQENTRAESFRPEDSVDNVRNLVDLKDGTDEWKE